MGEKVHTLIKELPVDERPREKLIKYGVKSLSNAELLAVLIRNGIKDTSAIDLSNKILSINEEGIRFLVNCTVQELSKIKGIGKSKACQIISAIELGKRIASVSKKNRASITSPKDVAELFMEEMRYYNKEFFKILLLNTKNEIITVEDVSIGSINSTIVHPREVYINAIKKSASSIILIHNHPSGNPQPSKEDIKITERLVEAGEIIGIEVLDHIIIGDGIYISFKEKSIIM